MGPSSPLGFGMSSAPWLEPRRTCPLGFIRNLTARLGARIRRWRLSPSKMVSQNPSFWSHQLHVSRVRPQLSLKFVHRALPVPVFIRLSTSTLWTKMSPLPSAFAFARRCRRTWPSKSQPLESRGVLRRLSQLATHPSFCLQGGSNGVVIFQGPSSLC